MLRTTKELILYICEYVFLKKKKIKNGKNHFLNVYKYI